MATTLPELMPRRAVTMAPRRPSSRRHRVAQGLLVALGTVGALGAAAALGACSDGGSSDPTADVVDSGVEDDDDAGEDGGDTVDDAAADPDTDPDTDTETDTGPDAADGPSEAALAAFCDGRHQQVEARIDAVLAELDLEEKAALMHGITVIPTDGTWATAGIEEHDIPGFHMLDGPRGLSRFSGKNGTAFPVAMARGATWDPELEREVGRMIGAELRLAGADTLLAPTVNVLRHPRWGRAQETYGEDPLHIGIMGSAFVEGAQQHVMAVVKHYAVNSIEDTRLEVDVRLDERTLREIYLPHFRMIVEQAGVAGVMTSYNRINGEWGSEQDHLIRDILHRDWDFAGFTVSDFTWGTHDTVAALDAGLDVEMQYAQVYGDALVSAVRDGLADEALVDAAVRRILRAQWCWRDRVLEPELVERESEAALELAERAAAASMVLLENRGDALPIDRAAAPTIALVGTLADTANTGDRGSSHVRSTDVVTALEGLTEAAGDATVVHLTGDLSDESAAQTVADADVVVAVVGYSETEEGEGQVAAGDRESLELPEDDIAIIQRAAELHDRVVVVVVGGSSFVTDGWGDAIEALVMSWYSGARGGAALATLLFGDADFSGRLPISFAASDEDLPPFDNTSIEVEYGYFHGYRHLQNNQTSALYPFGYGLSYSGATVGVIDVQQEGDEVVVQARMTNRSDRAGTDVVQVYVAGPDASTPRAPRDLVGFARVAVPPGGAPTAVVRIPLRRLARWTDDGWTFVPGRYLFEVGSNVADLPHRAQLDLDAPPGD